MLFRMRFNTPFRMFPLLTVQGGFVHVDMRFNFENCYNFYRAGAQLALAIFGRISRKNDAAHR